MTQNHESACCPPVDVDYWQHQTHQWHDKLFIKDTVPQIFHMPLPGQIGKVITRMWKKAEAAEAAPDLKDFLLLAYDPSPWKSELYMAVTQTVPDAENTTLSGTFITKVFDGPFQKVPQYIKEMNAYLKENGKVPQKYYFYFPTCPKCAKETGHHYIIAFAEV